MQIVIYVLLIFSLFIDSLEAAAIRGKVRLRKKGSLPQQNSYVNNTFRTDLRFMNWRIQRKFEHAQLKNYEDPSETIIYLSKIPERYKRKEVPEQEPIQVHIEGARFYPRTLPLMVGSTIEFVNRDPVAHDVYSYSVAKPFQTDFFKNKHAFVTFKKTGGVTLKSSVYKNMQGEVLVLDHPYFTKSRADGYYSMRNIRPGIYHVTAWHPELPSVTKEVEVNFGETITIDFNLSTMGLPEVLTR